MTKDTEHAEDNFLKNLVNPLEALFENRLGQLGITKHQALKILDLDHKTFDLLMASDARKLDILTIIKLSEFLKVSTDDIINSFFSTVQKQHRESIDLAKKRNFLVSQFNLPALKKIGFIESINDFDHIESRIKSYFGYSSVFEYRSRVFALFSSGKRISNPDNLNFWSNSAREAFVKHPNPYPYDRDGLLSFFPSIRRHSTDVKDGLRKVADELFLLGITLIAVPKFHTDLHIHAATMAVNGKPCIALTKYNNFYASLWLALIHELHHVLYDWDAILESEVHFSIDGDLDSGEQKADDFARAYLFSHEKMNSIRDKIHLPRHVRFYAEQNHIHPAIIYFLYCREQEKALAGASDLYAKFTKQMSGADTALRQLRMDEFLTFKPIKEINVTSKS